MMIKFLLSKFNCIVTVSFLVHVYRKKIILSTVVDSERNFHDAKHRQDSGVSKDVSTTIKFGKVTVVMLLIYSYTLCLQ